MSTPSSKPTNGTHPPPKPPSQSSLEADIALLTRLLSQDSDLGAPDTNEDAATVDVEELLRRLEAAEGLADGVEERLDGIIGNLDSMLSDLEARAQPDSEQGAHAGEGGERAAEDGVASSGRREEVEGKEGLKAEEEAKAAAAS